MMAFVGAPLSVKSFAGTRVARNGTCGRRGPRAELDLPPGIPSGQDPLENAPLRHYVERPVETYENRSFSTVLPKNWAGETSSIGALDIPPMTKEAIEEERLIPVTAAETGAFLDYAAMMKEEREAQLKRQAERNSAPMEGRATCGPDEGKQFVSNYIEDSVQCVEYWGTPVGNVPRLFGGPGQ